MTAQDHQPDPWGIDLVPLREAKSRRSGGKDGRHKEDESIVESGSAGQGDVDLIKVLGQLARSLERIEVRLARIERASGVVPMSTDSTAIGRLRREP